MTEYIDDATKIMLGYKDKVIEQSAVAAALPRVSVDTKSKVALTSLGDLTIRKHNYEDSLAPSNKKKIYERITKEEQAVRLETLYVGAVVDDLAADNPDVIEFRKRMIPTLASGIDEYFVNPAFDTALKANAWQGPTGEQTVLTDADSWLAAEAALRQYRGNGSRFVYLAGASELAVLREIAAEFAGANSGIVGVDDGFVISNTVVRIREVFEDNDNVGGLNGVFIAPNAHKLVVRNPGVELISQDKSSDFTFDNNGTRIKASLTVGVLGFADGTVRTYNTSIPAGSGSGVGSGSGS